MKTASPTISNKSDVPTPRSTHWNGCVGSAEGLVGPCDSAGPGAGVGEGLAPGVGDGSAPPTVGGGGAAPPPANGGSAAPRPVSGPSPPGAGRGRSGLVSTGLVGTGTVATGSTSTSMAAVAVPPRPSSTVTFTVAEPGSVAFQKVCASEGVARIPDGVDQRNDKRSPSGSEPWAVTRTVSPTSTRHGSQSAWTSGGRLGAGSGGGGGGGGGGGAGTTSGGRGAGA